MLDGMLSVDPWVPPVSPDLAILKLAKPLPDRFVAAVLNPRVPGVGGGSGPRGPDGAAGPRLVGGA